MPSKLYPNGPPIVPNRRSIVPKTPIHCYSICFVPKRPKSSFFKPNGIGSFQHYSLDNDIFCQQRMLNIVVSIKYTFFSEVWRNMPGQNAVPSFENGKCKFDVPVDIEDFINEISVTYGKGAFILKGSFQERTNYHLRASTGTDMGICATINPVASISSRSRPDCIKELVPFTQLVKVRRGKLVLALPSIRFS